MYYTEKTHRPEQWRYGRMAGLLKMSLLLVFLLFVTACGRPQYEYLDNKDVRVESINQVQEGEFLIVNAVLRNADADEAIDSVYRIEWFGKEGNLIEKTSWRPLKVKGGASMPLRERSTIPGAVEFTLILSNDAS